MKHFLPAIVLAVLFTAPASAQPVASTYFASGLVALSMPVKPMQPGRWDVTIAPALLKAHTTNKDSSSGPPLNIKPNDHADLKGWGFAASALKGLKPHWGVAVTGLTFQGKGTYDPGNTGLPKGDYDVKSGGEVIAAAFVWDHWTGDGFRFPILFGLHYENLHDDYSMAGGTVTVKDELSSIGPVIGLSPQFVTGPIRWAPFVMGYIPLGNAKQSSHQGTLVGSETIHTDSGPGLGINIVYIPLNLAFFTQFGTGKAAGTTVTSLRWTRSFGG